MRKKKTIRNNDLIEEVVLVVVCRISLGVVAAAEGADAARGGGVALAGWDCWCTWNCT